MRRRSNPQANRERLSARIRGVRPADFPVGSLESRAAVRALLVEEQKRFQLIYYVIGKPRNLEASTCERQIWPDGSLFELVMLDGRDTDLTEAQLEAFIQQHPVVNRGGRNTDEQSDD